MKIITALFIVCFSSAYANDLTWFPGSIVLKDKTVLRGEVAIQPAYDLILFRDSSGLMVYPAHKLSSVYYHDTLENINRKFISISEGTSMNRFSLYEIVFFSEILVVRKVAGVKADPSDHAKSYHYFVRFEETLIPFRDFKAKIFNGLKDTHPSFANEVRERKLDPASDKNIIPIIKLYTKHAALYTETAASVF